MKHKLSLAIMGLFGIAIAEELPEVTVTDTRVEREVRDVPASVSIIGKDKLEQKPLTKPADIFSGIPGVYSISRNQGFDTRLIIRGAGRKATFGTREILILLNGAPVTSPDGVTVLDFVDTSLIDKVEIVKDPTSVLGGLNAYGGVVNLITRSPFERKGGELRIGFGDFNTQNHNFYYSTPLGKGFYLGLNVSRRQSDNSWRERNKYEVTHITLQPSYLFSNGDTWENYINYTKADLQLPGTLVVRGAIDQFSQFLKTGRAPITADPWKHQGLYTEVFFLSSKLTKKVGSFDFIPTFYINRRTLYGAVPADIYESDGLEYGTDIQINYRHGFGVLTAGLVLRGEDQKLDFLAYRDVLTGPRGRIIATLSDKKGNLLEKSESDTKLVGFYLQESVKKGNWVIDLGIRADRLKFEVESTEYGQYNFILGRYQYYPSPIRSKIEKTYNVLSPKLGVSYKLAPWISLYGNISTGYNTPDEWTANPELEPIKVTNYETGLKIRRGSISLDAALYTMDIRDEVVRVIQQGGVERLVNAGKTRNNGFELGLSYEIIKNLLLGASYTYADYKFREFSEPVRIGNQTINVSRNGNRLPFIPRHYYSLFATYKHSSGIRFSVQSDTWGSYYMDNANTEKYEGYKFVTSANLGYQRGNVDLSLMVDNLFDKRYALEATKDLTGTKRYRPAPPRTFLVRFTYSF